MMGCNTMKPTTAHKKALSAEMRLVASFCTIPKTPHEKKTTIENQTQEASTRLYSEKITIATIASANPNSCFFVRRSRRKKTARMTVHIGYSEVTVVTTAAFVPTLSAA